MPKRRESSESDDEIEKCSSVLTFVSDFFIIIIIIIFQLLAAQTKRRESSESESQPDQYIDRRDAANHLEAPCATNGIDPLALHPYRRHVLHGMMASIRDDEQPRNLTVVTVVQ